MTPQEIDIRQVTNAKEILTLHQQKNNSAISLLKGWLEDETGYDEKSWPIVKKTLEENNLSSRKKFHD